MGEHKTRPPITQKCPRCGREDRHVHTWIVYPGGRWSGKHTFTGCEDCVREHATSLEPNTETNALGGAE